MERKKAKAKQANQKKKKKRKKHQKHINERVAAYFTISKISSPFITQNNNQSFS